MFSFVEGRRALRKGADTVVKAGREGKVSSTKARPFLFLPTASNSFHRLSTTSSLTFLRLLPLSRTQFESISLKLSTMGANESNQQAEDPSTPPFPPPNFLVPPTKLNDPFGDTERLDYAPSPLHQLQTRTVSLYPNHLRANTNF